MKKIAIVGYAYTSMHLAPFNDPEWEIWGLNDLYNSIPRWDRMFQLHTPAEMKRVYPPDSEHWGWLQAQTKPVYMTKQMFPNVTAYPKDEILKRFPRKYFTNSLSWMIAYAIHEGAKTIGVWGVDMALDEEYGYQRPSCEYFIGIAEGMGIEVIIPEESELLRCNWLYGFEDDPYILRAMKQKQLEFEAKAKELEKKRFVLEQQEMMLRGAADNAKYAVRNWRR